MRENLVARKYLRLQYSQPPILPSPHFRWVVKPTYVTNEDIPIEGMIFFDVELLFFLLLLVLGMVIST